MAIYKVYMYTYTIDSHLNREFFWKAREALPESAKNGRNLDSSEIREDDTRLWRLDTENKCSKFFPSHSRSGGSSVWETKGMNFSLGQGNINN